MIKLTLPVPACSAEDLPDEPATSPDAPPRPFDLDHHALSGCEVLVFSGEIDVAAAARLRAILADTVSPMARLVLDMSQVTYLSQAGLTVLADMSGWLDTHGGCLRIAIGEKHCEVLLAVEAAHLQRTLPLFDTVGHALAA